MADPGDPDLAKRRIAVRNERAKLLANALDRASTACITVGILGPTAAALYGVGSGVLASHGVLFGISVFSWLIAATVLHVMARQVLGRIQ